MATAETTMNPGETTRRLIDDVKELTGAVRLDNRSYTTPWDTT
jgi:hypothetical protein